MRSSVLSTVLVTLLLAGCAPTTLTYYKPIGPGSYFKTCGGGPDNYLGWNVADGLALMIHTGVPEYQGTTTSQLRAVWVSFHVNAGHTLRIPSGTFQITNAPSGNNVPITVTEVTGVAYERLNDKRWERKVIRLPITQELRGGVLPTGFGSEFQGWFPYGLEIPVNQRGGDDFSIDFPRVLLDGRVIEIPSIRVEYGSYAHIRTLC